MEVKTMRFAKTLFKKLIFIAIASAIFFLSPLQILAGNYGEGTYGGGDFNIGSTPTPTIAPTSTNNNNSSSTSPATPPGCDKTVTAGVPDLFEVKTSKDSMALYFAPPAGEYSSFYVAFSKDPNSWQYGAEYGQSAASGALHFTIGLLSPNTTYYVKLRPGNGCATGNWSNVMKVSTTSGSKIKTFYRYSAVSRVTNSVASGVKTAVSKVIYNQDKASATPEPAVAATAVPTGAETSGESQAAVAQPTVAKTPEKKKFCILWWCF